MATYMKTRGLRLCGILVLAVIAASFFHCYIDKDHLCLHHRPIGQSLSQDTSVERDLCLCFSHGYFVPVFTAPQARCVSLGIPLALFAESPRTIVVRDIFHPPLV
jgi:hypothetical protein